MPPIAWSVTNHRFTVSTNMPLSLKGSKPLVITCVLASTSIFQMLVGSSQFSCY